MDEQGIDVEALSINPFWYAADRDLAARLVSIQNENLASICAEHPDRFVALASVALQHPDLATRQLEQGIEELGLRGAAIGGDVNGEEISAPRFDPFWAKAEELADVGFIPPRRAVRARASKASSGQRLPFQRHRKTRWKPPSRCPI